MADQRPEQEDREGEEEKGFLAHYVRGVRTSSRHNAAAYGFSIAATSSFAAVTKLDGAPSLLDIFVFIVGASVGFAILNAIASGGYSAEIPDEPAVVVLLGTSFSILSIAGAVGVAVGIGYTIGGWPAWLLGSLGFTLAYLLGTALELGIAAQLHERGGYSGEQRQSREDGGAA
jgi:hypothetical protein